VIQLARIKDTDEMARAAGFQNQFMLALTKAIVARGRRAGELYDLSNEDLDRLADATLDGMSQFARPATRATGDVIASLRTKYTVYTGSNFDQYINLVGDNDAGAETFDGQALSLRCRDLGLSNGWTGNGALKAFNRNGSRASMSFLAFLAALDNGEKIPDGWYLFVLDDGRVVDVGLYGGVLFLGLLPAGYDWYALVDHVFPSVGK